MVREECSEKVTFTSDPTLQNTTWWQIIRQRKLSDFGRIISQPNDENRAKICPGSAEILCCIFLSTEALNSQYIAIGQC